MGIIINCLTCKKSTDPILDKITNKVYCSVCDTEISVSHFVKVQLKDLKQYRNKKRSFAVKCVNCNNEITPVQIDNDIVCGACNKPLSNITAIFKKMLIENLNKLKEDM